MNNHPNTHTTDHAHHKELSEAFTKRLGQLGLSRRQFAIKSGLSRQTLHNIEVECRTDLAPSTLAALDAGLHWPTGTAHALAHGVVFEPDPTTSSNREVELRWQMVRVIASLSLEELETMVYQWAEHTEEPTNNGG